jgi:hypothetical protein
MTATRSESRQELSVTLLELVVEFCRTGALGPMCCGAKLDEIQSELGPYTDRAHDRRPRRWRPRLHFWGNVGGGIEVMICHSTAVSFSLQTWTDEARLPVRLGLGHRQIPCLLRYGDVIDALDRAGIEWQDAPEGILPGENGTARNLRISPTNVELFFWDYDPTGGNDNTLRLKGAYKNDPAVECGPHPDSGAAPPGMSAPNSGERR